jgi:glycosyltransferase involved in cell wall biosynthesis
VTTVLSLQTASMGHVSHARLLRRSWNASGAPVTSLWHDRGSLLDRAVTKLLTRRLGSKTWRAADRDAFTLRADVAYSRAAARQIAREIDQTSYGVVHVHTQALALTSLSLMRRVPFVVSGDATAAQHARATGASRISSGSIHAERRVFASAAGVVLWSEYARRSAIVDQQVAIERTHVVMPGVAPELFELEAGRREDLPRLLFVGSDLARKGGLLLLDVFAERLSGRATLDIVTGAAIGELPPGVAVHRGVEPFSARWKALFASADAFVLPTTYEPFGIALAEAQAAGLPVVSTRDFAIPEIVVDGSTGLLVPALDAKALAQALDYLIENADGRRAMGRAARHHAQRAFDADRQAQKLLDVLLSSARTVDPR